MKKRLNPRLIPALGLILAMPAGAEVLNVPGTTTPASPAPGMTVEPYQAPKVDRSGLPRRGTSMDSVRAKYGEPLSVSGPVGEPPITRWTYSDFFVFFEYQHVINAVIPGKPPQIYRQDELRPGR